MENLSTIIGGRYDYFQFGVGVLIVTWISGLFKDLIYGIFSFVKSRFYYSARLSFPDLSFQQVLEFVAAQNLIMGTREVSVTTETSRDEGNSIKILPSGTQWFFYKGYLTSITRTTSEKKQLNGMRDDYLDLNIYFGNKQMISDILEASRDHYTKMNQNKTKIFSLDQHGSTWLCISTQNKREIDSVFLEKEASQLILNDLTNFVNGKNWYVRTGVPYRRGYLLYGPPGTGKTSFILSIAGKFNKSISVMNLSKGVNDSNINNIIQKCQKDTILVMEDIDSAFVNRNSQNVTKLSFSALLNAIDGLAASDGRILVMTTNHIENLSPALIRPGRVDLKVKFDYATPYQIENMYKKFFDKEFHYILDILQPKLKNYSISTAQLQGWFIGHRDNPMELEDTIDEFIKKSESDNQSLFDDSPNTQTPTDKKDEPQQLQQQQEQQEQIPHTTDLRKRLILNH
ncbi:AAA ATPase domain-containing protein [Tieghemostelium lacteum]|uniref:AAA ATPase domain-containing protein n=1 Tax=Tieghemostelium lacteum TaxID=361077 RepID=A0A152A7U5_TIELA|nr:AAA ATPase domain-containing protein [Tieghemostelium lacteum]|eukprot:KYR02278.1 AAA ATPase domain-containing protein [Tieghemostelium lacteum]